MKASVLATFGSFNTKFEGALSYMYTDKLGLVTTGIGNLIDPIAHALALPWKLGDGTLASRGEVQAEWDRVKAAWPGVQSVATRSITTLHLDQADIDHMVAIKARENEDVLRGRYSNFDTMPADAQMGIHSMAWAMGPAFRFPQFDAAVNANDFRTAAVQSVFRGTGVQPRIDADKILFNNAAIVTEAGGDPEVLYYPTQLTDVKQVKQGTSTGTTLGIIATTILLAGTGAYLFFRGMQT
jgi:GH24 family phage-related lysozyme (muramidase)